MDKKKLERLERRVLRCDAQQAVEKKLELHPTFPDDEEDEEDEDEEVDEDGKRLRIEWGNGRCTDGLEIVSGF
jgi:hypothetical protein